MMTTADMVPYWLIQSGPAPAPAAAPQNTAVLSPVPPASADFSPQTLATPLAQRLIAEYGGPEPDLQAPVAAALIAQHGRDTAVQMLKLNQALMVVRTVFGNALDVVYQQFAQQHYATLGHTPTAGDPGPMLPVFDLTTFAQAFCQTDSVLTQAFKHFYGDQATGNSIGPLSVTLGGFNGAQWKSSQFLQHWTGAAAGRGGSVVMVDTNTALIDPRAVSFDGQLGLVTRADNLVPPPPKASAEVLAQVDALLNVPIVRQLSEQHPAAHRLDDPVAGQLAAYYGRDRFFRMLDLQEAYQKVPAAYQRALQEAQAAGSAFNRSFGNVTASATDESGNLTGLTVERAGREFTLTSTDESGNVHFSSEWQSAFDIDYGRRTDVLAQAYTWVQAQRQTAHLLPGDMAVDPANHPALQNVEAGAFRFVAGAGFVTSASNIKPKAPTASQNELAAIDAYLYDPLAKALMAQLGDGESQGTDSELAGRQIEKYGEARFLQMQKMHNALGAVRGHFQVALDSAIKAAVEPRKQMVDSYVAAYVRAGMPASDAKPTGLMSAPAPSVDVPTIPAGLTPDEAQMLQSYAAEVLRYQQSKSAHGFDESGQPLPLDESGEVQAPVAPKALYNTHFDVAAFTRNYANGDTLMANAFAKYHGAEAVKGPGPGMDDVSWTIGKLMVLEGHEGGQSLQSGWRNTRVGTLATSIPNLNRHAAFFDDSNVWFDPSLGFVTSGENVKPQVEKHDYFVDVFTLLAVTFVTWGVGTAVSAAFQAAGAAAAAAAQSAAVTGAVSAAGTVGTAGAAAGVAAGTVGAAASTGAMQAIVTAMAQSVAGSTVSGLINDNLDLRSIMRGALISGATAGLGNLLGQPAQWGLSQTGEMTDVVKHAGGALVNGVIGGASSAASGGSFKNGFIGGVVDVVAGDMTRAVKGSLDKVGSKVVSAVAGDLVSAGAKAGTAALTGGDAEKAFFNGFAGALANDLMQAITTPSAPDLREALQKTHAEYLKARQAAIDNNRPVPLVPAYLLDPQATEVLGHEAQADLREHARQAEEDMRDAGMGQAERLGDVQRAQEEYVRQREHAILTGEPMPVLPKILRYGAAWQPTMLGELGELVLQHDEDARDAAMATAFEDLPEGVAERRDQFARYLLDVRDAQAAGRVPPLAPDGLLDAEAADALGQDKVAALQQWNRALQANGQPPAAPESEKQRLLEDYVRELNQAKSKGTRPPEVPLGLLDDEAAIELGKDQVAKLREFDLELREADRDASMNPLVKFKDTTYTVKAGDTTEGIARALAQEAGRPDDWRAIQALLIATNKIRFNNVGSPKLYAGQTLEALDLDRLDADQLAQLNREGGKVTANNQKGIDRLNALIAARQAEARRQAEAQRVSQRQAQGQAPGTTEQSLDPYQRAKVWLGEELTSPLYGAQGTVGDVLKKAGDVVGWKKLSDTGASLQRSGAEGLEANDKAARAVIRRGVSTLDADIKVGQLAAADTKQKAFYSGVSSALNGLASTNIPFFDTRMPFADELGMAARKVDEFSAENSSKIRTNINKEISGKYQGATGRFISDASYLSEFYVPPKPLEKTSFVDDLTIGAARLGGSLTSGFYYLKGALHSQMGDTDAADESFTTAQNVRSAEKYIVQKTLEGKDQGILGTVISNLYSLPAIIANPTNTAMDAIDSGESVENSWKLVGSNTLNTMGQLAAAKWLGSSSRVINSGLQAGISIGLSELDRRIMRNVAETDEAKRLYSDPSLNDIAATGITGAVLGAIFPLRPTPKIPKNDYYNKNYSLGDVQTADGQAIQINGIPKRPSDVIPGLKMTIGDGKYATTPREISAEARGGPESGVDDVFTPPRSYPNSRPNFDYKGPSIADYKIPDSLASLPESVTPTERIAPNYTSEVTYISPGGERATIKVFSENGEVAGRINLVKAKDGSLEIEHMETNQPGKNLGTRLILDALAFMQPEKVVSTAAGTNLSVLKETGNVKSTPFYKSMSKLGWDVHFDGTDFIATRPQGGGAKNSSEIQPSPSGPGTSPSPDTGPLILTPRFETPVHPVAPMGESLNKGTGKANDILLVMDRDGTPMAAKTPKTSRGLEGQALEVVLARERQAVIDLEPYGGPRYLGDVRLPDGRRAIAMEPIDGVPAILTPEFPVTQAHIDAANALFARFKADGVQPTDSWPGNYLLTRDGRVVPIDSELIPGGPTRAMADELVARLRLHQERQMAQGGSADAGTLRGMGSRGVRNTEILTPEQQQHLYQYVDELGLNRDDFLVSTHVSAYSDNWDKVFLGPNMFKATEGRGAVHSVFESMTPRAAVAHEAGHMMTTRAGLAFEAGSLFDEVNASLTGRDLPGLNSVERYQLLRDAVERARLEGRSLRDVLHQMQATRSGR